MRKLWIILLIGLLAMMAVVAQDDEETAEEEDNSTPAIEIVEGEVSSLLEFEHDFDAEAGEIITVVVRSLGAPLDLTLVIVDEDDEVIAENDDHESDDESLDVYDARIAGLEIPADGTYTVQVSNEFFGEDEIELVIIRGEIDLEELGEELSLVELGVIEPTPPPVDQRRTTGPCTASVNNIPARLRNFPSLERSRVGGELLPDQEIEIIGQYFNEDDGFIWYQLGEALWVRQDIVILNGDCSDIRPIFL